MIQRTLRRNDSMDDNFGGYNSCNRWKRIVMDSIVAIHRIVFNISDSFTDFLLAKICYSITIFIAGIFIIISFEETGWVLKKNGKEKRILEAKERTEKANKKLEELKNN